MSKAAPLDFIMAAMTAVREPIDYVQFPIYQISAAVNKLIPENRYQLQARGGVFSADLMSQPVALVGNGGSITVQLLDPTNATAKGSAVEFELADRPDWLKGTIEIYKQDVRPVYAFKHWSEYNVYRYNESQEVIAQALYGIRPINKVRELLEILDTEITKWSDYQSGRVKAPEINSDGTILTPEIIAQTADDYELLSMELSSIRDFVMVNNLASPISYEKLELLLRKGRVLGICAALDIASTNLFELLSSETISAIWSQIANIINQDSEPVVETEATSSPVTDAKKKPFRGKDTQNKTDNLPELLPPSSEPEATASELVAI